MADDPVIHVEPLRPWMRGGLFAAVVFFHVGGGWALTQIHPDPIVVGEQTHMDVSFVTEQPSPPTPEPPQEQPPEPPQLESMIQPPPPDLPPPAFPVPPPPPPKPVAKPQPKPVQATPTPPAPPAAAPPASTGPRAISASQVAYLSNPPPLYPARALRNREQGSVLVFVIIDSAGRPAQVTMSKSSGHPLLDEAALSAVRGWRFRAQTENGVPVSVQVNIPVNFVLQ